MRKQIPTQPYVQALAKASVPEGELCRHVRPVSWETLDCTQANCCFACACGAAASGPSAVSERAAVADAAAACCCSGRTVGVFGCQSERAVALRTSRLYPPRAGIRLAISTGFVVAHLLPRASALEVQLLSSLAGPAALFLCVDAYLQARRVGRQGHLTCGTPWVAGLRFPRRKCRVGSSSPYPTFSPNKPPC